MEEIWNTLPGQVIAYLGEHFGSAEHMPPIPDFLEESVQLSMRMVDFASTTKK